MEPTPSHRIDLVVAEAEHTQRTETAERSEIHERVVVEVELLQGPERERWKYLGKRGGDGGGGGGREGWGEGTLLVMLCS